MAFGPSFPYDTSDRMGAEGCLEANTRRPDAAACSWAPDDEDADVHAAEAKAELGVRYRRTWWRDPEHPLLPPLAEFAGRLTPRSMRPLRPDFSRRVFTSRMRVLGGFRAFCWLKIARVYDLFLCPRQLLTVREMGGNCFHCLAAWQ